MGVGVRDGARVDVGTSVRVGKRVEDGVKVWVMVAVGRGVRVTVGGMEVLVAVASTAIRPFA